MKAILDASVLLATKVAELEGELAIGAASLAELHFGVLVTADAAVRYRPVLGYQPPQEPRSNDGSVAWCQSVGMSVESMAKTVIVRPPASDTS